jgi:hypothetical protein
MGIGAFTKDPCVSCALIEKILYATIAILHRLPPGYGARPASRTTPQHC